MVNEHALSAKDGHVKFTIKLNVTILVEDNPHVAKYQSNLLSGLIQRKKCENFSDAGN